jgi:DtxR family Mn-dependent transcriptional regulator
MKKDHHRDLADHEIEHVVAELWSLEEMGRVDAADLRATVRIGDLDVVLERLATRGLIRADRLALTSTGRDLAAGVIRRHRLAELLLSSVLDVKDDRTVNRTACVMEHILSAEVTESVCSFLGHPKFCPHGKPIPAGRCCRSFSTGVEPLVQPLDRLAVGQSARIAYIVPKDPERLVRLSGLGVVPGAMIRLRQKRPAAVISIGETTLAVDPEIAEEVYVKRLP